MRQFILAANAAYPTAVPLTTAGQVAITYLENGVETLVKDAATAAKLVGRGNIVWKNPNTTLGQILYPIFKKNFTFTKGVYSAATTFSAELTIGTVEAYNDYSVIVAKKGLKFNERNKWTSTVHTGAAPTAADVAQKIANHINANTIGNGVKAVVDGAKITITAVEAGKDYAIVPADGLMGTAVTVSASGIPAYGDAAYVKDLANKAAADAGFEYTYNDFEGIYPAYPLNPLAQPDKADVEFTIYTLRFAEPREMKTRDEVVHQIIQIAYPTGSDAITTMDTILDILAGGEVPAVGA
jgi:hypothetical protein